MRGVRARAIGPEDDKHWLEALSVITNRFDTLERMVRNQAQIIAGHDARAVEIANRVNDQSNKCDTINGNVNANFTSMRETCRDVIANYESKGAAAALDAKVDGINAQRQAVMTGKTSYGQVQLPQVPPSRP